MTIVCASYTCIFWTGIEIWSTEVVGWPQESCNHISHVVSHLFIILFWTVSHLRAVPIVHTPSSNLIFMARYLCWSIQCDTTVDLYLAHSRYSQLYMYYSGAFRDRCSSISPESASPREFLLLQPKISQCDLLSVICIWWWVWPHWPLSHEINLMPEWDFFSVQYGYELHLCDSLAVFLSVFVMVILVKKIIAIILYLLLIESRTKWNQHSTFSL